MPHFSSVFKAFLCLKNNLKKDEMDFLNAVGSRVFPESLKLTDMPYLVPYPQEDLRLVSTAKYGQRLVATVRDPKDLEKQYNVWLPKRVANTPQRTIDEINGEKSVFLVHTGTKRAKNPQFDSELFVFIKSEEEVATITVGQGIFQEKREKQ